MISPIRYQKILRDCILNKKTDIYKKIKGQLGRSIDQERAVFEVTGIDRIKKGKYEKVRPFLVCP